MKDIPPVHQKRVLEILNEAQSKTKKGGSAQKPAPNATSSTKAKAQSAAPSKLGKAANLKSVQDPKDAKTLNGVNRNKENVKMVTLTAPNYRSPTSYDVNVGQVTLSHAGASAQDRPVYRLSEVLNCIAHAPPAPREEIKLENLRLPPGITITKVSVKCVSEAC